MHTRCYNEKFFAFKHYGGRGIRICDEWLQDFPAFERWAVSHGYRDDLTIDRIDANGNYVYILKQKNGDIYYVKGWAGVDGVCLIALLESNT